MVVEIVSDISFAKQYAKEWQDTEAQDPNQYFIGRVEEISSYSLTFLYNYLTDEDKNKFHNEVTI